MELLAIILLFDTSLTGSPESDRAIRLIQTPFRNFATVNHLPQYCLKLVSRMKKAIMKNHGGVNF